MNRFTGSRIGFALLLTIVVMGSLMLLSRAEAANSVPRRMIFNSRLLDSSGSAVTTPHRVRFTFWIGSDAVPSDLTGTGAIRFSAPNFVGWKEEQTFTPSSNGSFYVEMGAVNPLPGFANLTPATLSNLFMQVEVKPAASPDSAYEILDPRPLDAVIDRSPVLSVPFALNADRLDQRDIGTGSGSIPLLGSGGMLPFALGASGTKANTFVINADGSGGDVTLKFGSNLSKSLSYDTSNNWFIFNDNLKVQGNLTVTGLINGVDVSALAVASTPLKVSSGAGLSVHITAGNYRINGIITNFTGTSAILAANADSYLFFTGSGGLQVRTGGFPTNASFIPLAKVTTSVSGVMAISDKRVLQSDDREHAVLDVLHPEYRDAAFNPDGTHNVGQLSVDHDPASKNNCYRWTSSKSELNDYEVVVRYTLPQSFARWQADPLTLSYKTSSGNAADNKADVMVYDTAGNVVNLNGASAGLVSASWAATTLGFTGSPVWTPGQTFLIRITLSSRNAAQATIGDLALRYTEMDKE